MGWRGVAEDSEVDVKLERKRFEDLTRYGVAVRAYEGCHAKFAVVDDRDRDRRRFAGAQFTGGAAQVEPGGTG